MLSRWLHRCAVALACCTFGLVVVGALATGVASPRVVPLIIHQTLGVTAGVLAVTITAFGVRGRLFEISKLGIVSSAAIAVQAYIGSTLASAPPAAAAAHSIISLLLFAGAVRLVLLSSRTWSEPAHIVHDSGWPSLRSMSIFAVAATVIQTALGAGYRFHLMGATPHVVGSIVVTAVLLVVSIFVLAQFGSHAALRRPSMILLGITCLQVVLGIFALMARLSPAGAGDVIQTVLLTAAHLTNGALTLAASLVLAMQVLRNVQPQTSQAGQLSPVL